MRSLAPVTLSLLLCACAMTPMADAAEGPPPGAPGTCSDEDAARFIGKVASAAVGAQIREATGAAIFQWVPPDSAVTMDYRTNRVRVSYDRAMVITAVRCG